MSNTRIFRFEDGYEKTVDFGREPTDQEVQSALSTVTQRRMAELGGQQPATPRTPAQPVKAPLKGEEPVSWPREIAATAAEVVLPIGGAFSPLPGGAVLGSGLGSIAGQKIRHPDQPIDWKNVGLVSALGFIPASKLAQTGRGVLGRVAAGAAEGAAIGTGAHIVGEGLHGRVPGLQDTAGAALGGAAFGAPTHALLGPRPGQGPHELRAARGAERDARLEQVAGESPEAVKAWGEPAKIGVGLEPAPQPMARGPAMEPATAGEVAARNAAPEGLASLPVEGAPASSEKLTASMRGVDEAKAQVDVAQARVRSAATPEEHSAALGEFSNAQAVLKAAQARVAQEVKNDATALRAVAKAAPHVRPSGYGALRPHENRIEVFHPDLPNTHQVVATRKGDGSWEVGDATGAPLHTYDATTSVERVIQGAEKFHQQLYGEPKPTGKKDGSGTSTVRDITSVPVQGIQAAKRLVENIKKASGFSDWQTTTREKADKRALGRAIIMGAGGRPRWNIYQMRKGFHELVPDIEHMEGYFARKEAATPGWGNDFINRMEHGQIQATGDAQVVANEIRTLLNHYTERMQKLGEETNIPLLRVFGENYFPHVWQRRNPETGKTELARWVPPGTTGSLSGTGAFTKQRTFEWHADAIAEGFESIDKNPLGPVLHKIVELERFESGVRMVDQLIKSGLARWGYRAEDGYVFGDDKLFKMFPPPPEVQRQAKTEYEVSGEQPARRTIGELKGGQDLRGTGFRGGWMLPKEVAIDLARHQSPGFHRRGAEETARGSVAFDFFTPNDQPKGLYDTLRRWTNESNSLRMGFSAFHVTVEGFNGASDGMGELLYNLSKGNTKRARELVPQAIPFVGLGKDYRVGKAALAALKGDPGFTPEFRARAEQWLDAGGQMSDHFTAQSSQAFEKALKEHNAWGMLRHALPTLSEGFSRPLFENLVPNVKRGAFLRRYADLLREHPHADQFERQRFAHETMNSVDDIYGKLDYNSLFMDNKFKQTMHLAFQAPGWAIGTWRQAIGAVTDPILGRGVTHRTAHVAGLFVTAALYSTLLELGLTGKVKLDSPQDAVRHAFGGFVHSYDKDGTPRWFSIPSYTKDIFHAASGLTDLIKDADPKQLTRYFSNKASPLVEAAVEFAMNTKYPNQMLRDRNDVWQTQLKDIATGIAATLMMPFSAEMLKRAENMSPDAPMSGAIMSAMGIGPAPKELAMSNLARQVDRIASSRPSPPATKAQVALRDVKGQVTRSVRDGSLTLDAIRASELSPAQLKAAIKAGRQERFANQLGRLSIPELLHMWPLAKKGSDEHEQDQLSRVLRQRLMRSGGKWLAGTTDPAQRQAVLSAMNDFIKDSTIRPKAETHVEDKPIQPNL
jgi:hypothetical protein